MKIADLFAEIGFKFDVIKLREVSKIIGDLNISSLLSATSLAVLGVGIEKLIEQMKSAADYSAQLLNVSKATGINPTTIQQLDAYFQKYGAGAGEATAALQHLNDLRMKALMGDPGASQAFIFAGILPTDDDLTILDKLREKMNDGEFLRRWGLATHQSTENINELKAAFEKFAVTNFGLSQNMLRGLDVSNEAWQKQHELLTMNADTLAINADFTQKWAVLTNDLSVLWKDLVTAFEPFANVLMPILDQATKLLDVVAKILLFIENITGALKNVPVIKQVFDAMGFIGGNTKLPDNFSAVNMLNQPSGSSSYSSFTNSGIPRQNNVTINMAPITIQANNPQEFTDKFDDYWNKYMIKTSSQFGLGST